MSYPPSRPSLPHWQRPTASEGRGMSRDNFSTGPWDLPPRPAPQPRPRYQEDPREYGRQEPAPGAAWTTTKNTNPFRAPTSEDQDEFRPRRSVATDRGSSSSRPPAGAASRPGLSLPPPVPAVSDPAEPSYRSERQQHDFRSAEEPPELDDGGGGYFFDREKPRSVGGASSSGIKVNLLRSSKTDDARASEAAAANKFERYREMDEEMQRWGQTAEQEHGKKWEIPDAPSVSLAPKSSWEYPTPSIARMGRKRELDNPKGPLEEPDELRLGGGAPKRLLTVPPPPPIVDWSAEDTIPLMLSQRSSRSRSPSDRRGGSRERSSSSREVRPQRDDGQDDGDDDSPRRFGEADRKRSEELHGRSAEVEPRAGARWTGGMGAQTLASSRPGQERAVASTAERTAMVKPFSHPSTEERTRAPKEAPSSRLDIPIVELNLPRPKASDARPRQPQQREPEPTLPERSRESGRDMDERPSDEARLPPGWTRVRLFSGSNAFFHAATRIATASRPFVVAEGEAVEPVETSSSSSRQRSPFAARGGDSNSAGHVSPVGRRQIAPGHGGSPVRSSTEAMDRLAPVNPNRPEVRPVQDPSLSRPVPDAQRAPAPQPVPAIQPRTDPSMIEYKVTRGARPGSLLKLTRLSTKRQILTELCKAAYPDADGPRFEYMEDDSADSGGIWYSRCMFQGQVAGLGNGKSKMEALDDACTKAIRTLDPDFPIDEFGDGQGEQKLAVFKRLESFYKDRLIDETDLVQRWIEDPRADAQLRVLPSQLLAALLGVDESEISCFCRIFRPSQGMTKSVEAVISVTRLRKSIRYVCDIARLDPYGSGENFGPKEEALLKQLGSQKMIARDYHNRIRTWWDAVRIWWQVREGRNLTELPQAKEGGRGPMPVRS